jgi:hypothetical protein
MRRATPRVVPYGSSETSKFVVEGLRVEGKRVLKFFPTHREGEAWLRKTLARVKKEGEGAIHMPEALRIEATTQAKRLKAYGATITQAVDYFIAHRATIARSCTVSALIVEFLLEMKKRRNALRHSFGSYHLAHFQDASRTAFQLGHSSPKMLAEHYDAVVLPKGAAEWWQIVPAADYSNVVAFGSEVASA